MFSISPIFGMKLCPSLPLCSRLMVTFQESEDHLYHPRDKAQGLALGLLLLQHFSVASSLDVPHKILGEKLLKISHDMKHQLKTSTFKNPTWKYRRNLNCSSDFPSLANTFYNRPGFIWSGVSCLPEWKNTWQMIDSLQWS